MGTLKRACSAALVAFLLVAVTAVASADDGWEARLLRQVEQLESKLKDLGESLPSTGSIEDRVRAIEGATAKLEKRHGVNPKTESYYEGSSESQRLGFLTSVVVSLSRRIDALPAMGAPSSSPSGGLARGERTAVSIERAATNLLWGGDEDIEAATGMLLDYDLDGIVAFCAAVRKAASAVPPAAYLATERLQLEVQGWALSLRDPNPEVARWGALELAYTRSPAAVTPLIEAAQTASEPTVREWAMSSLGMLGRMDALPGLIDLIADKDESIGRSAEIAVAEIIQRVAGPGLRSEPAYRRIEDSLPALQSYWRDYYNQHDAALRRRSGQTAHSPAESERQNIEAWGLAMEIYAKDPERRSRAEQSIMAMGPVVLREVLRALQAGVRGRRLAKGAAAKMPGPLSQERVRVWIGRLHDPDYRFAAPAASALWRIGSPACLDALIWALESHPEPWLRAHAAAALAQTGTRRVNAVAALVEALDQEDRDVRSNAYLALTKLTGFSPGTEQSTYSRSASRKVQGEYRRWLKENATRLRERNAK